MVFLRHYGFSSGNVEWWLQQGDGSNKLQDLRRSKMSVAKSESYSDFPESETALINQGGFNTYITYPGADPQTSQFFENVIGRTREKQQFGFDDQRTQYHEYNLVNAAEVRMLDSDEALIFSGREQTIKLKTTAYFESWRLRRQAKKGAYQMQGQNNEESLQTVGL